MKKPLYRFTTAGCWVYFTLLFGWLALYLFSGDRFAALSLVNMLAVYLFTPLPLVALVAIALRRAEVWAGVILGAAAFAVLWGGLFLPKSPGVRAGAGSLRVMTFNVLGWHNQTAPQIAAIRAQNADLVLLQELNPQLASALRDELGDEYPYMLLDPQPGVIGMGALSKYPLGPSSEQLPLEWVGVPQVLDLQWNGQTVTVVNFHTTPTTLSTLHLTQQANRQRQAQAVALVELAQRSGALIAAGDANATPLSEPYKIITRQLLDAWKQAGFGLGHTFPGSDIPGSSRPRLGPWSVPMWLLRIDYIFHSPHWRAVEAYTAPFDGVSDHRGVVVVLEWRGP